MVWFGIFAFSAMMCMPWFLWIAIFIVLPTAAAAPVQTDFPQISFKIFADVIKNTFDSDISLSTVLIILFTITENHELLSLHARQQISVNTGENNTKTSGWLRNMACVLFHKLENQEFLTLFTKIQYTIYDDDKKKIGALAEKLDTVIKALKLYPVDKYGAFQGELQSIEHKSIQSIPIICPPYAEYQILSCKSRALHFEGTFRDVPLVTLIKDTTVHDHAYIFHVKCSQCRKIYYADHICTSGNACRRTFLNEAQYLKIGQALWVDRVFSKSVLSGVYNFHASTNAYAQFWNDSFLGHEAETQILCHQVWQAFVQESIRLVATISHFDLELQNNLNIGEVVKHAFKKLGENGLIGAANDHTCHECVQPYRATAQWITEDDPAAMVGVDENQLVPHLEGEYAHLAVQDAERAQATARQNRYQTGDDSMN